MSIFSTHGLETAIRALTAQKGDLSNLSDMFLSMSEVPSAKLYKMVELSSVYELCESEIGLEEYTNKKLSIDKEEPFHYWSYALSWGEIPPAKRVDHWGRTSVHIIDLQDVPIGSILILKSTTVINTYLLVALQRIEENRWILGHTKGNLQL